MNKETLEEDALRQLFKNRSNCYADTGFFENDGSYHEGKVVQAMDEDCFIDTIKEWKEERMYNSKEDLREAYFSAIKSTGEGWNGEFAEGNDPDIREKFSEGFELWFDQYKKK